MYARERERMSYNCAWCGDLSDEVLEVINGQNTCKLCRELAIEGEGE
jgi:hypothetical protein